jgi:hypothetical protein
MPLFIQKIPHLLFGVSQRPNVQKDRSQLQSSDNWIARAAYGLAKRPPFAWVGKLSSSLTGIDGATIFSIQRDDTDRYRVVMQNGTLKVYDLVNAGAEITVKDYTSDSYKTDSAGAGFAHVTVGDATFIANKGTTVAKDGVAYDSKSHIALITIEQADFTTIYEIVLGGNSYSIISADQADSASRGQINTQVIAEALYDELQRGFANASRGFTIKRFGSTIVISRALGADFQIYTYDGLANQGMRLIKDGITNVEDLAFTQCANGTKVKVLGDPNTDKDDFWMVYDTSVNGPESGGLTGIWRETVAPKAGVGLDNSTMPHVLKFNSTILDGIYEIPAMPPGAVITDSYSTPDDGGWTEDETGTGVNEEDDDLITDNTKGRRRLIPGADGVIRQLAEVTYDLDTSRVPYGKDTIVNLIHRTSGGTETTLARQRYAPGDTATTYKFVVTTDDAGEGVWAATDRFKITMEYGDNVAPNVGEEAQLTMVGGAVNTKADLTPRYWPIRVRPLAGIDVTFSGSTNAAGYKAYREGMVVALTMTYTDIVDEFSITVPAGGYTKQEVATNLAAHINTDPGIVAYTATASGSVVNVVPDAAPNDDPRFSGIVFYESGKLHIDQTFTLNEFIGEKARNIATGATATITGNTTDGVFTISGSIGANEVGMQYEIIGTGGYFSWDVVDWDDRTVGDEVTNPWPTFTETTIRDMFFYRNRLGVVAGRSVVLSESGDFYNFFRSTVQQLVDGDRIDVESAHGDVAIFHSAISWNGTLYLWTENAQYELYGEPVLTPRTVRLDRVSQYFNTPTVRPLVMGPRLYFAHAQTGSGKIMEWLPPTDDITRYLARDITLDVPTYLPGQVLDIAGDYGHGVLAVLMDGDQDSIYIWSFQPKGDGTNLHEAWQRWTLPALTTARQIDFADGKLAVMYSYSDGVYLDEADLDQTIEGSTRGFIDRRQTSDDSGVSFVGGTDPNSLGPVFEYRFDEAAGAAGSEMTTHPDNSGNGLTITEHQDTQHFTVRDTGPVTATKKYAEIRSVAVLENNEAGGATIDLTGDFTAFAVIRVPNLSSQNQHPIFSIFHPEDNGGTPGEVNWFVGGNATTGYDPGELGVSRPYNEDPAGSATATPITANTWTVVAIRLSSLSAQMYHNGVANGTGISFSAGGTNEDMLRIGSFRSNFFTAHADMDMSYVCAFESALTAQQVADVSEYLQGKYLTGAAGEGGTITFPYPIATDNSEGELKVWRKDTAAEVTIASRPTTTTATTAADLTGVDFDIGVAYEARARLAPVYFRGQDGEAEATGRTQVRELQVHYNNTEELKVEVTPDGRAKQTVAVSNAAPTEGTARVPVLTRGETAIIELVSDQAGDARVNSIDVELQHTNRSRRA